MNLVEIDIRAHDLTGPAFASALARAEALKKALGGESLLGFDPQKIDSQLTVLKAKLQAHRIADLLDINMNAGQVEQELSLLRRYIKDAHIGDMLDVNLNTDAARRQLGALVREAGTLRFTPHFTNGLDLANLPVHGETVPVRFTESGTRAAAAALGAVDAEAKKTAADTLKAQVATALFTNAVADGMPMWKSAAGRFGLLRGHVQLFGGVLTRLGVPAILASASGLHLLTEAVVETAGTLIPAAVAFGVFGAAATPAVTDLYQQMKALNTASSALGQDMPGLSGGFSRMADAVQPQVYQLFGEALYTANHSTGAFTKIAAGAGKVLDDLGARFAYAVTQGDGFSTFTKNAVSDLSGWGNLIGNIGGIMGNLFKVLPGYAEMLLNLANGFTHLAEVVTGSGIGQGILKIGLAAHGAIFYIGLLSTGATILITRALPGIASAAAAAAVSVDGLGAAGAVASTGLMGVAGAAEKAAGLPWGWITVAVAALGFLAFQFARVKDGALQFNAAMQDAVTHSKLNNLSAAISSAMTQTAAHIASTSAQLDKMNHSTAGVTQATSQAAGVMGRFTSQMSGASVAVANTDRRNVEYKQGLQKLTAQQDLVRHRVAALAKQYGGTAGALAALNAAGITSAQITSKSSQTWAEALIEIQAYQAALKETTLQDGRLGAAQNALNYVAGDSANALGAMDSAITKVTSAQQQLLGVLIGGEAAFTNFEQVLGGGPRGTGQKLTGMAKDAKAAGASLNGLNTQSLTLANDFYSTVLPAAQSVVSALEMQNASTVTMRKAVATMAAEWGKYTGKNTAAKVATMDFINNALGPGTVSLKNLNKWVKDNQTSMSGFKGIMDQTMGSASKLAGVLSSDLNAMLSQDLLKTSGADAAMKKYTADITRNRVQTAAGQADRHQLIADLMKAGYSAKGATALVDGMTKSVDKLHGKNVKITATTPTAQIQSFQAMVNSLHGKTVTINAQVIGSNAIAQGMVSGTSGHSSGGIVGHAASGGVRNGLVLVGELGPELVSLPQGSRVWPHGVAPPGVHGGVMPSPASGGGRNYSITVNVPPAANLADVGRVTVEAIREFERGSGAGWRK